MNVLRILAAALALLAAARVGAQRVEVAVRKLGEMIVVDVTAQVAAQPEQVWEVLTDYDHMAEFVSAIRESKVLSRNGNQLEVAQTGGVKRGFLNLSFSTVRAVELVPKREIRSHLIRGDFKSYEFTTRIGVDANGPVTITHHGEYIPHAWVPPVIGPALIESETHKQYGDLLAEIMRRQAGARAASAPGSTAPTKQ